MLVAMTPEEAWGRLVSRAQDFNRLDAEFGMDVPEVCGETVEAMEQAITDWYDALEAEIAPAPEPTERAA